MGLTIRTRGLARATTGAAIVLAALLLLVLPAGLGSASSVPSTSSTHTLWAYGAVKTISFSGTNSNGVAYNANATYGFSVILNQTNTSATTFLLNVTRTMGVLASVEYCLPNCNSPRETAALSVHAWENVSASASLSTTGTVWEAGVPVPAVALLHSSAHLAANYTETFGYHWLSGPSGIAVTRALYLSAAVTGHSTVAFSPALGLFPTDLSTAQTWNSTAAFNASAAANWSSYLAASGTLSNSTAHHSGSFAVPAAGNVSLQGSYSPSDSVMFGGVNFPAIALTLTGPFSIREGVIVLPNVADLFAGSSAPWSGNESGAATASMSFVDARLLAGGHFGLGASAWVFHSATQNPASALALGGAPTTGLTTAVAPPGDQAPTTTVQGQPESVTQAEGQQNCIVTGSGCPTIAGSSPTVRGVVGLVTVAAIMVVVVAAIILVAERRRMPPPVYPNASLYPPGASGPSERVVPPKTTPPPAEDDPLGNLW